MTTIREALRTKVHYTVRHLDEDGHLTANDREWVANCFVDLYLDGWVSEGTPIDLCYLECVLSFSSTIKDELCHYHFPNPGVDDDIDKGVAISVDNDEVLVSVYSE